MPKPSELTKANWRKLYQSGAVPQKQFPAGSLVIDAITSHHHGVWDGYVTLSLGSETVNSGPGWSVLKPLCWIVVPDRDYQLGAVLPKIPGNAIPPELCFSD